MDNLRKDWQDTSVSIRRDSESYASIINGKRKTALQNLAERYRRFSNLALVLILLSFSWIFNPDMFPGNHGLRIAVGVSFAVYALMASIMDRWLYKGIQSIDIVVMPVSEVVRKALFYRKRHLQFIVVLLPIVLAIIAVMAWSMDNLYFRLGIVVGFIAGVAIGIRQLLAFLADYRAITSED
ncbi:MAG: hypothetical protein K2H38_06415 [Muribaculaceae bacterium]|nr:hypothetical protein [Muribaculaceae bacterium]MDE6552552.1 hypothetical protein [Muribaculaceae bacterium]